MLVVVVRYLYVAVRYIALQLIQCVWNLYDTHTRVHEFMYLQMTFKFKISEPQMKTSHASRRWQQKTKRTHKQRLLVFINPTKILSFIPFEQRKSGGKRKTTCKTKRRKTKRWINCCRGEVRCFAFLGHSKWLYLQCSIHKFNLRRLIIGLAVPARATIVIAFASSPNREHTVKLATGKLITIAQWK